MYGIEVMCVQIIGSKPAGKRLLGRRTLKRNSNMETDLVRK